jgi:hypothetical protein
MKTSKPVSDKTESAGSLKKEKKSEISANGSQISEEIIREKANDLYLQRLERGEHGTAENDWIEAEKHLRDSGF